jgi:hypothetical protein
MWIDPMQTTRAESAMLRSGGARMTRGSAWVTRNTSQLSHAPRWRLEEYPEYGRGMRGFRLSLTLPCTSVRGVVE